MIQGCSEDYSAMWENARPEQALALLPSAGCTAPWEGQGEFLRHSLDFWPTKCHSLSWGAVTSFSVMG